MFSWRDAARAAHDFHAKYPVLTHDHRMVDEAELIRSVSAHKKVLMPGYSIGTHRSTSGGKHVYAQLLDYGDADPPRAEIIIGKECNRCWTRFAIAKELMHIYCDLPDGHGFEKTDISRLFREAYESRSLHPEFDTELCSEGYCLVITTELMIPWRRRGIVSDMLGKGAPTLSIAESLKIPCPIIEIYRDWFAEESAKLTKELGLATLTDP